MPPSAQRSRLIIADDEDLPDHLSADDFTDELVLSVLQRYVALLYLLRSKPVGEMLQMRADDAAMFAGAFNRTEVDVRAMLERIMVHDTEIVEMSRRTDAPTPRRARCGPARRTDARRHARSREVTAPNTESDLSLVPPHRLGALLSASRAELGLTHRGVRGIAGTGLLGRGTPTHRARTHGPRRRPDQPPDALYGADAGSVVPERSELVVDLSDRAVAVGDQVRCRSRPMRRSTTSSVATCRCCTCCGAWSRDATLTLRVQGPRRARGAPRAVDHRGRTASGRAHGPGGGPVVPATPPSPRGPCRRCRRRAVDRRRTAGHPVPESRPAPARHRRRHRARRLVARGARHGARPGHRRREPRAGHRRRRCRRLHPGRPGLDRVRGVDPGRLPRRRRCCRTGPSTSSGPASGYRGNTNTVNRTITVYVCADDTPTDVAGVLAHELGHAFDVMYLDGAARAAWQDLRGLDGPWWPDSGAADFHVGAGDFAEAFARLVADSPSDAARRRVRARRAGIRAQRAGRGRELSVDPASGSVIEAAGTLCGRGLAPDAGAGGCIDTRLRVRRPQPRTPTNQPHRSARR